MRISSMTTTLATVWLVAAVPAMSGTKTTSSWAAPDLAAGNYAKVAVLAKVSDETAKRTLEDRVVEGLAKRGIRAVAAYQVFTEADLANDETVVARARELGVDAALVFSVTGQQQQVKSSPNVHASVGVPVRAGPFSVFLGTSVPLGGGSSTTHTATLQSEFYSASATGPRWIATYLTDLKSGNAKAAESVAAQALKQVKKAHLFD